MRTVACFGQCALAPVVEVNHRICGHVNERTLQREDQDLSRESEVMPRNPGYWRIQRGTRSGAGAN